MIVLTLLRGCISNLRLLLHKNAIFVFQVFKLQQCFVYNALKTAK